MMTFKVLFSKADKRISYTNRRKLTLINHKVPRVLGVPKVLKVHRVHRVLKVKTAERSEIYQRKQRFMIGD